MREFSTAAKAATEDEIDAPIIFTVDGEEYRSYRPTTGQVAVMFTNLTDHASDANKIAGVIDFFTGCLDTDSHQRLVRRLMDREDPFELEQVNEIMAWLMEEWNARPTQSPSGSTPSRRTGGPRSTGNSRRAVLTPSDSDPIVSAI